MCSIKAIWGKRFHIIICIYKIEWQNNISTERQKSEWNWIKFSYFPFFVFRSVSLISYIHVHDFRLYMNIVQFMFAFFHSVPLSIRLLEKVLFENPRMETFPLKHWRSVFGIWHKKQRFFPCECATVFRFLPNANWNNI